MTFEFSDKDRKLTVYNYDADGVYLNTVENLLIEANTGLPALSTVVAPPALEVGQSALFDADAQSWSAVYDHRGKTIYNTTTKEPKTVKEIGEIESGWTLLEPPAHSEWDGSQWVVSLDELKAARNTEINAWRNAQESATDRTVTVDDIVWDANPAARTRIESTLASTFIPPFWTDADNVDQSIDRDGLQAVHTAIVQAGFEIHARQRAMKTEVAELTTVEEVQTYQVGWSV